MKRKRKERIKKNGWSLLTKIARQAKGLKNEINEWKRNEWINIGGMKKIEENYEWIKKEKKRNEWPVEEWKWLNRGMEKIGNEKWRKSVEEKKGWMKKKNGEMNEWIINGQMKSTSEGKKSN